MIILSSLILFLIIKLLYKKLVNQVSKPIYKGINIKFESKKVQLFATASSIIFIPFLFSNEGLYIILNDQFTSNFLQTINDSLHNISDNIQNSFKGPVSENTINIPEYKQGIDISRSGILDKKTYFDKNLLDPINRPVIFNDTYPKNYIPPKLNCKNIPFFVIGIIVKSIPFNSIGIPHTISIIDFSLLGTLILSDLNLCGNDIFNEDISTIINMGNIKDGVLPVIDTNFIVNPVHNVNIPPSLENDRIFNNGLGYVNSNLNFIRHRPIVDNVFTFDMPPYWSIIANNDIRIPSGNFNINIDFNYQNPWTGTREISEINIADVRNNGVRLLQEIMSWAQSVFELDQQVRQLSSSDNVDQGQLDDLMMQCFAKLITLRKLEGLYINCINPNYSLWHFQFTPM